MHARPKARDSGMETITMPAARRPSGSSVMTTSAMAMPKSEYRRSSRLATFSDWSKPHSRRMRPGQRWRELPHPLGDAIAHLRML